MTHSREVLMKIRMFFLAFVLFTASVFTCYGQDAVCLDSRDAARLEEYITYLPALGLEKGIQKSLTAKMSNAAMLIGKQRINAASNILDALVLEIQALAGNKIAPELAEVIAEKISELKICDNEFAPFGFPFEVPGDIGKLAAFGIPNWSGTLPHNGIDLILNPELTASRIISPTAGRIASIKVSSNPFSNPMGQLILQVEIYVNSDWTVSLAFEPSTMDETLKTEQIDAIKVQVGDSVEPGSPIGDLLAGNLGYPHLHYMVLYQGQTVCAYQYSSAAARAIFDAISTAVCVNTNN
jgi:hypothetical protein